MKNIIFIGGIHGVGKTYFCNNVLQKFNLKFYSASDLISKIKNQQFSSLKTVKNINENQDILITAINQLTCTDKCLLLDGHFCLIDKDGDIKRVPKKAFYNLSLKAIIVLKDSPEKIISRLEYRDKITYTRKYLDRFQEEELKYSLKIANSLNVPYLVYCCSEDYRKVYDYIEKTLKDHS